MSNKVIDNLYHVFRKVKLPAKIEGCTVCCISEAELFDLERGVRSATTKVVSNLAHNGMSTIGSAHDYKYFTPRILHEMILDKDFWSLCVDSFTRRLKEAGFNDWSDNEKTATLEALKIVFEEACADYMEAEDWLYGLAVADFEISDFLKILDYPKFELVKVELILNYLEYPIYKSENKIRLSVGYISEDQYKPIKQWVDTALGRK